MFYTYVLKSLKDGKNYIGATSDLKSRVRKHNAGSVKSTKWRRPFNLIYVEQFETKKGAYDQEKFYKSKIGSLRLKEILLRGRAAR